MGVFHNLRMRAQRAKSFITERKTEPTPAPKHKDDTWIKDKLRGYDSEEEESVRKLSNGNSSIQPRRDHPIFHLPTEVITNIFGFLCPHSADHTLTSYEESAIGGCRLCDMRDLSAAIQVCRKWHQVGMPLMYGSIRIDPVHYCELEDVLNIKRQKQAGWSSPPDASHIPVERLELLTRTMKENERVRALVQYLKMPHMVRSTSESAQILSKLVFFLTELRYIDLPDSFFKNDRHYNHLRSVLMQRCTNLKKMVWREGSEKMLSTCASKDFSWRDLEEIELSGIRIVDEQLVYILATFPKLKTVRFRNMLTIKDELFGFPNFPPIDNLILENCPTITAPAVEYYIRNTNPNLLSLSIHGKTQITLTTIPPILSVAPRLTSLTVEIPVTTSLPSRATFPHANPFLSYSYLTSSSLKTLTVDIHPQPNLDSPTSFSSIPVGNIEESHYKYILYSLSSLPALRHLRVGAASVPKLLARNLHAYLSYRKTSLEIEVTRVCVDDVADMFDVEKLNNIPREFIWDPSRPDELRRKKNSSGAGNRSSVFMLGGDLGQNLGQKSKIPSWLEEYSPDHPKYGKRNRRMSRMIDGE
ncbi:hypothetical protein BJ508DRAFT_320280 [Ascobolus immersus RN42]|uniref:Uncharacterized protein n=1 Tax=Ascobolus immersus RN42 TaxID=1160509 RepID=A0A3N4IQG5_ASCIM|nr:hypothetical protein BJ508DRAFT_320280 [Ascobolus immersus RN42]